jgi:hypothetical protein
MGSKGRAKGTRLEAATGVAGHDVDVVVVGASAGGVEAFGQRVSAAAGRSSAASSSHRCTLTDRRTE